MNNPFPYQDKDGWMIADEVPIEPAINTMYTDALFSSCKRYRYSLLRRWDKSLPELMFVCLNPSTANEVDDDPTVRRCLGFAKQWGFGTLWVGNIFALRATDPSELYKHERPVSGAESDGNDYWLRHMHIRVSQVIAGWGNHGKLLNRGAEVLELLGSALLCLGMTKEGQPKHPLYLAKNTDRHFVGGKE